MNILFIGPYRQNDEWGESARHYLKCLQNIKSYNVSSAPIYMGHSFLSNIPIDIIQLENNYFDKYDIIIQHALPSLFEKCPGYNIGIYHSETKNLDKSIFIDKINIMDELWVCSEQEKHNLISSGVTIPIINIGLPIDIDKFQKFTNVKKLDIQEIENKFVFYIIADYDERNNIDAAIIAYNRAFSNHVDVQLIINTKLTGGKNPSNDVKEIHKLIMDLKAKLRLYNNSSLYANEIIIYGDLEEESMMSLHQTGNCLLVTNSADCYSRHAISALAFGNSILCNDGNNSASILQEKCSLIKSMMVPIVIDHPPARFLYTGWETWHQIDILDLEKNMKEKYELWLNNQEKTIDYKEWINNFSYNSIAKKIEDRLCQL